MAIRWRNSIITKHNLPQAIILVNAQFDGLLNHRSLAVGQQAPIDRARTEPGQNRTAIGQSNLLRRCVALDPAAVGQSWLHGFHQTSQSNAEGRHGYPDIQAYFA